MTRGLATLCLGLLLVTGVFAGKTLDLYFIDVEGGQSTLIVTPAGESMLIDAGYRGGNAPVPYDLRVFTSGQKRRMTDAIKREMRRRAAVEPVIGHMKSDHRLGRNFLAHATGDAINAVLAAVGNNFRRLLNWLKLWLAFLLYTLRAQQTCAAA